MHTQTYTQTVTHNKVHIIYNNIYIYIHTHTHTAHTLRTHNTALHVCTLALNG